MTLFIADLHIHSRFSLATSRELTARNIAAWARLKGVDLVSCGDFTHPKWLGELQEHLRPDGGGLFELKDSSGLEAELPWLEEKNIFSRPGPRFILGAEISSIYKKDGRTRKIHNLVFMPSFEAALKFNAKLGRCGNLASDGRPIIGLGAKDLLEMVLDTDPAAFLVPAHIWTPWFSLFGSKSGFDSIEECFEDLSGEIFALETGLSSDPAMNWRVSSLDRFRLVSNSDAHSGDKIAREANLFSGEMSFAGLREALHVCPPDKQGQRRADFISTVEFFPEEGKYHLDGHRACGVVLSPEETRERGGICPVCGRPVTVGVLSRVLDLADREEAFRPEGSPDFVSLVSLREICAEITGTGSGTKRVQNLLAKIYPLGSELHILLEAPGEDLGKIDPILAEAILRMRRREVLLSGGFDGQFGQARLFRPEELKEARRGRFLAVPETKKKAGRKLSEADQPKKKPGKRKKLAPSPEEISGTRLEVDAEQFLAVTAKEKHLLVQAGPGTGKTRTLIARIVYLLQKGVQAREILALTFTRRAAGELRERLALYLDTPEEKSLLPAALTLHSLAFEKLYGEQESRPIVLSEEEAQRIFKKLLAENQKSKADFFWKEISLSRETLSPGRLNPEETSALLEAFGQRKAEANLVDHTDLLEKLISLLEKDQHGLPYRHILLDEAQDLSALQLKLLTLLVGKKGQLFAIGDPNQAIYSFRGGISDPVSVMSRFWPALVTLELGHNYRSAEKIVKFSRNIISDRHSGEGPATANMADKKDRAAEIFLFSAPNAISEADWIAGKIKELLGGTSLTFSKSQKPEAELAPGDIAILLRTRRILPDLLKSLQAAGLPFSIPAQEPFFADPRVAAILDAAAAELGLEPAGEVKLPGILHLSPKEAALALWKKESQTAGVSKDLADIFLKGKPLRELLRHWKECGGWAELLSLVYSLDELELVGQKSSLVRLMTIHAAKGLEFEAVFLPGLEEGLLPFYPKDEDLSPEDLQEERRIFYVGLTRASRFLFLSHCEKRELFGREHRQKTSRFLQELSEDVRAGVHCSKLKARQRAKESRLNLWEDKNK